jgi:hypothetical protein
MARTAFTNICDNQSTWMSPRKQNSNVCSIWFLDHTCITFSKLLIMVFYYLSELHQLHVATLVMYLFKIKAQQCEPNKISSSTVLLPWGLTHTNQQTNLDPQEVNTVATRPVRNNKALSKYSWLNMILIFKLSITVLEILIVM